MLPFTKTAGAVIMATLIGRKAARETERTLYLAFVALGILGVVLGFVPPSWQRFQGEAPYPAPLALQIHAGLFLGWVALITAQVFFIRQGQVALHRRLGVLGAGLIPAMALSSVFAETWAEKFAAIHEPGGQRFLIVPIFSLGLFLAFTIAGLLQRRTPALHKRLIFLGTTLLFGAAWSRVTGPLLRPLLGTSYAGFFTYRFIMTNVFVVMLIAADLQLRGRVERVTAIGAGVILLAEIAVTLLYPTGWWLGVADVLIAPFPGPTG